jgi:NAD(P)H-hydrate repair Nnr-like enzyme with NAD(P)H-hydrate epimerase domain
VPSAFWRTGNKRGDAFAAAIALRDLGQPRMSGDLPQGEIARRRKLFFDEMASSACRGGSRGRAQPGCARPKRPFATPILVDALLGTGARAILGDVRGP